eukprot:4337337-Pyramimonas_sp.AAC.1
MLQTILVGCRFFLQKELLMRNLQLYSSPRGPVTVRFSKPDARGRHAFPITLQPRRECKSRRTPGTTQPSPG